jgi:type II secretory pathway component GspD/PulD (secretin)
MGQEHPPPVAPIPNTNKTTETIQLNQGDPIRVSFGIVEVSQETGDLYQFNAKSTSQDPNSTLQSLSITLPSLLTNSKDLGLLQGTTIIGETVWEFILKTIISEGNGRIIANTFGITDDNQPLSFDATTKEPYQTIKAVGYTDQLVVEFLDIGVKANVTPTIDPIKQAIKLKLDFEVSEILREEEKQQKNTLTQVPIRSVRHIITNVTTKPDQLVILGGLDKEKKIVVKNGIPILRRIPLIGLLFSSKETKTMKTKLYLVAGASIPKPMDIVDFNNHKDNNEEKMKKSKMDEIK